ncbi:zinc finger MYM-type protein 1-like isoform X1, partial [Aphis craccivora]
MPIIPALESSRKTNIALNRQIIFELIDITLFLARHNLSFRGHREGWEEKNKENFKDILLLMAPQSYALFSHINSIKSQVKRSTIRLDIKKSRMFSISIDSTFGAAKKNRESPVTTGKSLFDLFELVMEREDLDWENELVEAQAFIDKSDYEFEVLRTTRIKKVPRKHDERCTDERIQDPIQLFKINTVLPALDHVNNEMNKRFNPDHIGILKEISLFSLKRIEEIMKMPNLLPIDSFVKLCNTYKILDINRLRTEYLQFTSRFSEIKKTLILPTKLHTETELNISDDEELLFSDSSSSMEDN